ncbi:hypothetical protein G6F60_014696 [Rhizopus arrhizus]|nr:hypothetical protein G6F60_014696 [Rhizopus arrhizus]
MAAHQGQLALQAVQVGQAVARVAGQAGAQRIGAHLARVAGGQEKLAGRGQVQGRAAADGAHHLHARTFAPGAVDVDDLVALLDRQVDGLPRALSPANPVPADACPAGTGRYRRVRRSGPRRGRSGCGAPWKHAGRWSPTIP